MASANELKAISLRGEINGWQLADEVGNNSRDVRGGWFEVLTGGYEDETILD